MKLHRAVGLLEKGVEPSAGSGTQARDDTCVRAFPDGQLNFLTAWVDSEESWYDLVQSAFKISRANVTSMNSYSFAAISAQVNVCSEVASVFGSFAINLFLSKVLSGQHSRIRQFFPSPFSPVSFDTIPSSNDLLQRRHGGLSRNIRKKKNDVMQHADASDGTLHCLSDAGGFF